jgi:hypothetical protein
MLSYVGAEDKGVTKRDSLSNYKTQADFINVSDFRVNFCLK